MDRATAQPVEAERAEGERLQKVIAAAGIASRRAAEELIAAGRVRVDGRVVRTQGMRVDPSSARVEVDGERINVDRHRQYWLLNKPRGVVTTNIDPQGRRTVRELVRTSAHVYPVGRLDADTTGLVLLTDDGELAHRMMHPRFGVERVYVAEVRGVPSREDLAKLRAGVRLEDGIARAKAARARARTKTRAHVELVMTEGRKHEVRRMLEEIGFPVIGLARVAFGPLRIGDLAIGKTRKLTPAEVGTLLASVGM